ncbi:hypothetical protein ACFS6H_19885 [Terrimonas rubra]|uniref:Uncharacterized protein n=1 Tax=Terrimonas rubra TaxID=1035890 RepID=A0ABW6ABG4_9BACT
MKENKKISLLDMNQKLLEKGHIVVVRYSWNSYVGEIGNKGLHATGAERFAFFGPHPLRQEHTYQILGHISESHPDYNKKVLEWYNSESDDFKCPIKITVYDNVKIQN